MTICSDIAASGPKRRLGTAHERERANARAHRIAERLQGLPAAYSPSRSAARPCDGGVLSSCAQSRPRWEATASTPSRLPRAGRPWSLLTPPAKGWPPPNVSPRSASRCGLSCASIRTRAGRSPASMTSSAMPSAWAAAMTMRSPPLTLVVLDGSSGETTCLCAGGEPPLVLRAGGAVEAVQICGAALGLFPGQGYAAAPLRLGLGDAVLLATDGLTEARNLAPGGPAGSRTGAFLGLEGLARLAAQAYDPLGELPRVGRSVFEAARAFAGGVFHDDACLLVAQRQAR